MNDISNVVAFIIMAFVPIIIINIFWLKAQKEFLLLYKKKFSPKAPLFPEEIVSLMLNYPSRFIRSIPYILFGRFMLLFRKYDDPVLNKSAKKVRTYFWVILLILIFNFLFQLFFFVL